MDCLILAVSALLRAQGSPPVTLDVPRRVDGNSFFDLQTALRRHDLEGVAYHADAEAPARCARRRIPLVIKVREPRGYHALTVLDVTNSVWRVYDSRTGTAERKAAELLPGWRAAGYQAFVVAPRAADPSRIWAGCIPDVRHALRESYTYQAEELENAARAFLPDDPRRSTLRNRAMQLRLNAPGDGHAFVPTSG